VVSAMSTPVGREGGDDGTPVRVFLLDDHELVRRGIRDLLWAEDDMVVVGDAATAEEALERIPQAHPDVAVSDVRLGKGSGVEVCREIRSAHPEVACVMLTSFADDEALFASIMAGAAGYVLKQIRGSELVVSIRRVAGGESLLDPFVTARVLQRLWNPHAPEARSPGLLDRPGMANSGPYRRRQNQPPDRRGHVPRREDREKLRVPCIGQVGNATPDRGGGLRRQVGTAAPGHWDLIVDPVRPLRPHRRPGGHRRRRSYSSRTTR
jgi:DNA-binding NarL/FixJ family response regulator